MAKYLILLLASTLAFFEATIAQAQNRVTTPEGFQFIWHKKTESAAKPQPGDYVYFHGYIKDGEIVVRSSREEGAEPKLEIPVANTDQEVNPIESALRLMSPGDSLTVLIALSADQKQTMGFTNDTLNYDVVLVRIETKEEYEAALSMVKEKEAKIAANIQATAEQYRSGKLKDKLQTTASGLKYLIHEAGKGAKAVAGNIVSVHYYGILEDGKAFDNSFSRGEPISFELGTGQVIPGWDEGLALLQVGAKATLFIPSELAYGEQGSPPVIPANALLIFYVELVSAQ